MRGIVLGSQGIRFQADCPPSKPAEGEVLVRVLTAGLCETDLQLARGYMGFQGILGHEFVGIAESGPFAGRRVVGEINASCRRCDYCQNGLSTHCPHRTVIGILKHDGAFADTVCVPQHNLHLVPDDLPTGQAVFTEPLAAAFQITKQVSISRGLPTVVLGDGRLGNLCAQVLSRAGCDLTVVGKHPRKLSLLKKLGIKTVFLQNLVPQRTAELVVDCTGNPTGLATALSLIRPRGTIILKTTVAGEQTLSLAPIIIDEVTVVGSRCGPFPDAIAALKDRLIDVDSLVDGIYPLESALEVFERARTEPVLKLLFQVQQE